MSDRELTALENYTTSALFSERERAALDYAEAITSRNTVPDEVFAPVRRHFTEDEIVELTATIAWEICAAKFNRALAIEGQGICTVHGPKT